MKMPHARTWQKILVCEYGKPTTADIISSAEILFREYCVQIPPELPRGSLNILHEKVYPGLAVYRSLLENGRDQDTILKLMESLFQRAFISRLLPGIRLLNLLPDPFPIVRYAMRKMAFGQVGVYDQELVADTRDTFAFNTHRCLIHDTLIALDAGELAPFFCSTDGWLAEALPKVSWERTQTLGRGGDGCDFRWSRIR